jgi:hypothetical protein
VSDPDPEVHWTIGRSSIDVGFLVVSDPDAEYHWEAGESAISIVLLAVGYFDVNAKLRVEFSEFAADAGVIVQYDNESSQDYGEGGAIWIRMDVRHTSTVRADQTGLEDGHAGGHMHRSGILHAAMFAPIVDGDGKLYALADLMEDHYRLLTKDSIDYGEIDVGRAARTPSGRYWQLDVKLPFGFDMEI